MEGHTRINQIPQSQIMNKNGERETCTSWSSCLWKLCELVSNVEEQLSIVFMYTGTPISSLVIQKCVRLKCFCFVYDVWTTDLGFCQVSLLTHLQRLTPAHKVFRDRMTKKCMQFHVSSPKQIVSCNYKVRNPFNYRLCDFWYLVIFPYW
jgi:hypothetical protein